jgi:hypothetical protein
VEPGSLIYRKSNRQNSNSKIPQITIQQRLLYSKQFSKKIFQLLKKNLPCVKSKQEPKPTCAAAAISGPREIPKLINNSGENKAG